MLTYFFLTLPRSWWQKYRYLFLWIFFESRTEFCYMTEGGTIRKKLMFGPFPNFWLYLRKTIPTTSDHVDTQTWHDFVLKKKSRCIYLVEFLGIQIWIPILLSRETVGLILQTRTLQFSAKKERIGGILLPVLVWAGLGHGSDLQVTWQGWSLIQNRSIAVWHKVACSAWPERLASHSAIFRNNWPYQVTQSAFTCSLCIGFFNLCKRFPPLIYSPVHKVSTTSTNNGSGFGTKCGHSFFWDHWYRLLSVLLIGAKRVNDSTLIFLTRVRNLSFCSIQLYSVYPMKTPLDNPTKVSQSGPCKIWLLFQTILREALIDTL